MDDRLVLFGLHEMEGIGWKTIRNIVSRVPLRELPRFGPDQLAAAGVPPRHAAAVAEQFGNGFVEARLETYRRAGVNFVTVFDDGYPPLLKQTGQPPWVLYYKGDIARLNAPAIAVVGTRNPTVYGQRVARMLAEQLSAAGVCVVSGLARGIDSWAHRGALCGPGGTIAVLGGPADTVYPPENAPLYREIEQRGLIVSEVPLGTPLHPGLFPLRNRIIAGLSLGTVIVEAAEKSGALITADLALEESRDVFAVPGPITSPKSAGPLALIRQGAKMVASVEHILEEYGHLLKMEQPAYIIKEIGEREPAPLSEDERRVLEWIGDVPVTVDELLERSGFPFGHLHAVLLHLTMKNLVRPLPGFCYVRL